RSSGVTSSAASSPASSDNGTDPKATVVDDQRTQPAAKAPHMLLPSLKDVAPQSNTPVSASSTTPSVQSIVTEPAAVSPQTAPPSSGLIPMANVAAELFSEVLNPFAGTSPGTPADTPASWMALAAVRREITTESSPVAAAASGPIMYVPVATVVADPTNPL